jgi:hypothetical protein
MKIVKVITDPKNPDGRRIILLKNYPFGNVAVKWRKDDPRPKACEVDGCLFNEMLNKDKITEEEFERYWRECLNGAVLW